MFCRRDGVNCRRDGCFVDVTDVNCRVWPFHATVRLVPYVELIKITFVLNYVYKKIQNGALRHLTVSRRY